MEILNLRQHAALAAQAAEWFSSKWHIPLAAYQQSIAACLRGEEAVPQWYLAMEDGQIAGGAGVIENDFHDRPDLTPNLCALFVEPPFRRRGIAGQLLRHACDDMQGFGIGTLYLVTDHTSFYERYGWRFFCHVHCQDEEGLSRLYIHEEGRAGTQRPPEGSREGAILPSPVGPLLLEADALGLRGVWFEGQKAPSGPLLPPERLTPNLSAAVDWLRRYFSGGRPRPDELPLQPEGSAFRQLIWQLLCEIPYGETVTYGELAKEAARQLGKARMSAQAVGGAVGHNPISILIPCHRVIGTGGNLTGYAGGLDLKLQLLTFEGIDPATLHLPRV